MSSVELADYVERFIGDCTGRVLGVGEEQYSEDTHQKFETVEFDKLLEMLQEEIQDAAVYAAMLDIRIRRIRETLKGFE